VVFAGFVAEDQKSAYYNLADAYVMPSTGEGFGFVFIEALACGVPCVASSMDGGREALLEGQLGAIVDPHDEVAVTSAVLETLARPKAIPAGLAYFEFPKFAERLMASLWPFLGREPELERR
jgi:phosphatidyl-myo-inositol dimannoside synthase